MEKFFANLKRLLEPRARPPAESTEQPTADRPPPPAGSAPYREPESAQYQEPASPDVAAADDVTEVRALLESVAETPVAAPVPETQLRLPAPEPEPAPSIAETPASQPEVAEVASTPSDGVGNTLVLTLATPVTTFMVERSSATVGRGPENPIRLDDLSVSRRHARIAYRQGGYWLSDLGSMGGTWVNGTRLSAPRRIAAGEVIDIGHCRLTVGFSADAAKTSARKTASRRAG
jgi:hypothetical protein